MTERDSQYDSDPNQKNVNIEHTNFSRYSHFIPAWLFESLMPLSPQARRAYLLQEKFRTPLTFDYVVFEIFRKVGLWTFFMGVYRIVWTYLFSQHLILTVGLIVAGILIYFSHKITQAKNTKLIREEIIFQILSDVFSFGMAFYILYQDKIIIWAKMLGG
jgi:hypothetical protein